MVADSLSADSEVLYYCGCLLRLPTMYGDLSHVSEANRDVSRGSCCYGHRICRALHCVPGKFKDICERIFSWFKCEKFYETTIVHKTLNCIVYKFEQ